MSITVSEFKNWMKGVEDMQGENWTPNKAQWVKIREKIELLITEPITPIPHIQPPSPPMYRIDYNVKPEGEIPRYTNGDPTPFF